MPDSARDTMPMPADASAPPDLTGRKLGDYQVLRRLGRGAMAEVYLAEQQSLRRQVALKLLRPDLARDASYVRRFQNEAMAAASLVHANIVQIYEVGQQEGMHFIAQEYVAGRNLAEVLKRHGPVETALAANIMRQVGAALQKAAEQGIVHRDIKPENIMLSRTGEVKVADFGLARVQGNEGLALTQIGVTMGTPLYMSPEQAQGHALDCRSDLYSFGVTCYHMLAGRPPFSGDNALAVAVQHVNGTAARLESIRPDLPEGLCRIVHRLMSRKPEDRYSTPRNLLKDLRGLSVPGDGTEALLEWSTPEIVALTDARIEATRRLDVLLKTQANPTLGRSSHGIWPVLIVGALALGALAAWLTREPPLLGAGTSESIAKRSTAWAQLLHAKRADTVEAWNAVAENFPADENAILLARQGLARLYIFQRSNEPAEFRKALPLVQSLAALGPDQAALRAFGVAGELVVYSLLKENEAANRILGQLTPEMIEQLDPAMRELLRDRIQTSRQVLSQEAAQRLENLLRGPGPEEATP